MSETPNTPWIHLGECPVCVDGLCRIRTCTDDSVGEHFYAICDECDATWTVPDTCVPRIFPDAQDPLCPICSAELYGRQAHWSLADELVGTDWEENAIFELPSSAVQSNGEQEERE